MTDTQRLMYGEWQDALAEPGCAFCILTLRSLRRYIDALSYESVNDRGVRATIRAARGFCAVHGQLLREAHDALGSAIIYRDVLTVLIEALGHPRTTQPSVGEHLKRRFFSYKNARRSIDQLAPQQVCPACAYRQSTEQRYSAVLLKYLTEDELLPDFARSAGLCVPHLRLALQQAPDAATETRLRAAQTQIWQRLQYELDEFIRKQDHQFRSEPIGPERTAWSRAIDLVSSLPERGCHIS